MMHDDVHIWLENYAAFGDQAISGLHFSIGRVAGRKPDRGIVVLPGTRTSLIAIPENG
jgi:hypothetical protein